MLNLFSSLFASKRGKGRPRNAGSPAPGKAKTQPFVLPKIAVPGSVDAIEIDYGMFPKINLGAKPKNTEFEEVRRALMRQAFLAVNPYYQFLCNLKGIRDNKDMQGVLRDIIFRHIVHFWNIPSSQNHHHSLPWGGLVHALDTACREAVLWQSGKIFAAYGVDSERTRKEPMWQGFAGFLVGMMHDVAKIFDMEIVSAGERPVPFRSLEGELLDFHLVHPEGVIIRWKHQKPSLRVNWNMMYVWTFVPEAVFKAMPHDLMIQAMYKLLSYEELRSDRDSVRNWSEKEEFHAMVVQAIGQWFLQAPDDFRQTESSPFHRLDSNWVACDARAGFVHELAKRLGHKGTDLLQALTQAGIVAKGSGTGKYYAKLSLHVGGAVLDRDTCLVTVRVFDKAFDKMAKGKEPFRLGNKAALIDLASRPAVQEIMEGVQPELAAYVYLTPATAAGVKEDGGPGPKSKGGSKTDKPGERQAKPTRPAPKAKDPEEEIDIDSAMPLVEADLAAPEEELAVVQGIDLLEATADATQGNGEDAPEALGQDDEEAQESPAQGEKEEQDAVRAEEEDAGDEIDRHIAAAVAAEIPFHETARGKITSEQAQERFCVLLEAVGKRPKLMQRQKGSIMWLTTSGQLFLRAPMGLNDALGLPSAGRLTEEQVALRSKFLAHLERLGYVRDMAGGSPPRQRLSFFRPQGDGHEAGSVYVNAVELAHEKILDLSPAFTERLKKLFSVNRSIQAQAADRAGEADV